MECNYKFMFFSAPRLKGRGVEVSKTLFYFIGKFDIC